jgi:hypothetical protein
MRRQSKPACAALPRSVFRQRGQAAVEYLYVLPILLLLLFGTLQFVFIYQAKLTLNEAAFAGTRQGALKGGDMGSIQDGLEAGLAPLFAHGLDLPALKQARQAAHDLLSSSQSALTTIVNPSPGALSDFQQTLADGTTVAIPNDNLMYRDPTAGSSGMNIQDANLLKVRVTICFKMAVPIVNRMIYTFVSNASPTPVQIDSSYHGQSIAAPELLRTATPVSSTGLCPVVADPNNGNQPVYRIPIRKRSSGCSPLSCPPALGLFRETHMTSEIGATAPPEREPHTPAAAVRVFSLSSWRFREASWTTASVRLRPPTARF